MGSRRPAAALAVGVTSAFALGAPAETASDAAGPGGGTLRVAAVQDVESLDPALARAGLFAGLARGTCSTLMQFRQPARSGGTIVVPDAAAGQPRVSSDGRTYRFIVRRGLRWSDGKPVTAANFARALGRIRSPAMRSPAADLFADVQRVSVNGRTLSIELSGAHGDLPVRMALPSTCPVPVGFPVEPGGVPLMVGSGPYHFVRYEPGRSLVLERNPYYRGDRPRRVNRLVLTVGGELEDNIRAVAEGKADVLGTEIPGEMRPELARRYGVNRKQFFQFRGTSITALVLNTSRPLFRGNPALRMAINVALDRAAIAGAGDGWPTSIVLTDQITTRWMPGWVDHRLYPLTRPDVARARRLAAGNLRGGRAILWISPARTALARAAIIVRNLAEIGLDVQVRTLANDVINAMASVAGANYDMDFGTFPLDYPDPSNVVIRLLGGENARKPVGNSNYAYFDVPAYNRRMAAADRLAGEARARAFSALDRDLMRSEAPWAPLFEGSFSLFVSARVGCVDRIPFYRLDWPSVCLG